LHTRGGDPVGPAGAFDVLHVLGTSSDADAVRAGTALARRGNGRFEPATDLAQLAGSLRSVLH
jgi:hypothetical protein